MMIPTPIKMMMMMRMFIIRRRRIMIMMRMIVFMMRMMRMFIIISIMRTMKIIMMTMIIMIMIIVNLLPICTRIIMRMYVSKCISVHSIYKHTQPASDNWQTSALSFFPTWMMRETLLVVFEM